MKKLYFLFICLLLASGATLVKRRTAVRK
ncbi:sortase B protein-sorting domain-containing protein [Polycladospora coralii]